MKYFVDPMTFNEKPSPEDIVESIKLEESQRNKGTLKIFLGMAAGVGKTFAMLEEAQASRKEQINVAVGNIEAHGRREIEALLKNLPQIAPKIIFYKNKEFKELNVEAIISLNPSIVLVDELAHNNIPGSKNEKRWQDVLEILDHGINVHTTLNIQHIESLKDIVSGITEMAITEIVPDKIIEAAHSIQLIDLTPDELLQRLQEGKVYTEGQSKIAALNFFQKDKLTALREIVLRYVADKVDIDIMRMATTKERRLEWKTHEKFLVAINQNLQSQKLIRTARRLAAQASASWLAVYVHTGKALSKEESEQLEKNQNLIRDLGAESITIYDPDIAEGIKRVAYQRDITQIILGRKSKNFILSLFQGPTLLDKLAIRCENINLLHVIKQEKSIGYQKIRPHAWQSKLSDYLLISFLLSLITALSSVALSFLGYRVVEFLFFITIGVLTIFFKRGPAIFAAILFGLMWSFFFFPPPPESSFSITDEAILLTLYVLTVIFTGIFIEKIWIQKEIIRKGEEKTSQLADLLRGLESKLALKDLLVSIEERLPKIVEGKYQFVIKNSQDNLDMDQLLALIGHKERPAALWAFENGQETGWSTETLPFSENLYIPLKGSHSIMGILIYTSPDKHILSMEERNLIAHFCQQFSSHLESRSV